jgi:biotin synthase
MESRIISTYTEKIIQDGPEALTPDEADKLAALPDDSLYDLFLGANKIRTHYKKDRWIICSLINAKSGRCSENCAFCAQSGHHKTAIETYPMKSEEEIVARGRMLAAGGAKRYSMVTSGFMLKDHEMDTVCRAAGTIRSETGLTVCGSLGTLTPAMARRLKESGVSVFHHNLETARSYFDQVCTTHAYDDDIETVRMAHAAGLKVCSGGIMGLGESWQQRLELAFTVRDLKVEGIPVNFLNPIAGTKMENRPLLTPMEALKCIALYRFVNADRDIIICGGREVTLRDYQSWIFFAGANGMMVGNYLTTAGRNIEADMDMFHSMPSFSMR